MPNWQKVAAERLDRIRALERAGSETVEKARRAIEFAVHATCLASLSDPAVKRMIDTACEKLARDLGRPR
jgi:hypothetical protein